MTAQAHIEKLIRRATLALEAIKERRAPEDALTWLIEVECHLKDARQALGNQETIQ